MRKVFARCFYLYIFNRFHFTTASGFTNRPPSPLPKELERRCVSPWFPRSLSGTGLDRIPLGYRVHASRAVAGSCPVAA